MKKHLLISGAGTVLALAVISYIVISTKEEPVGHMMTYEESASENTSMGDGHTTNPAVTSITEQVFLQRMIPHHEEAVRVAKAFIASENTLPEAKTLAAAIVLAQEKEIVSMKSWYATWFGTEYQDDGTYSPMMEDLSVYTGADLDRAFLKGMIEHHTGALLDAQAVAPNIKHQEMLTLAKAIAENQSNEIITMRILLKQLPAKTE